MFVKAPLEPAQTAVVLQITISVLNDDRQFHSKQDDTINSATELIEIIRYFQRRVSCWLIKA